jgi:hypothetical protein
VRSSLAETVFTATLPTSAPNRAVTWQAVFRSASAQTNGYRPFEVTLIPLAPNPVPTTRVQSITVQIEVVDPYMMGNSSFLVTKTFDVPAGSTQFQGTMLVPVREYWSALDLRLFEDGKLVNSARTTAPTSAASKYSSTYKEGQPSVLVIDSRAPRLQQRAGLLGLGGLATNSVPSSDGQPKFPNLLTMMLVLGSWEQIEDVQGTVPINEALTAKSELSPNPLRDDAELPLANLLSFTSKSDRLAIMHPLELPAEEWVNERQATAQGSDAGVGATWLALSSYDLIFLSLDELQQLADQQPARFANLRRWVLTGQTLCVWGVGERFAQLGKLEQLLGLSRTGKASSSPSENEVVEAQETAVADRSWGRPAGVVSQFRHPDLWLSSQQRVLGVSGGSFAMVPPTTIPSFSDLDDVDSELYRQRSPSEDWLRTHPLGLGLVVAMQPQNPFPGTIGGWDQFLATIGPDRWRWALRHGVLLNGQDNDFQQFGIPRVGEPPVLMFLVLNTLFAIVIGPLNYFVLKNRRRLYLLLLTVPLAAALVTGGLLSFALLSDGIRTRARICSVTYYDRQSGEAAHWSRQCYYASFTPGAGLIFPPNAAVYQVYGQLQERDPNQRLNWDRQQNLQRGFIRSRTLSQFISLETRPAKTPFRIRPVAGSPAAIHVKNELPQAVPLLIVRDRDGQYYSGAVPAAGTAELSLQPDVELLRKSYLEQLLGRRNAVKTSEENGWRVQPADKLSLFSSTPVALDTITPEGRSVLDRYLNSPWLSAGAAELRPGQFLALVDEAPGLSIGVRRVTEEGSVHLLFGEW